MYTETVKTFPARAAATVASSYGTEERHCNGMVETRHKPLPHCSLLTAQQDRLFRLVLAATPCCCHGVWRTWAQVGGATQRARDSVFTENFARCTVH